MSGYKAELPYNLPSRKSELMEGETVAFRLPKNPEPAGLYRQTWNGDQGSFQSLPDGYYKYILTYVHNFTKCFVLNPLKSKRAEKVVQTLLPVFLTFGALAVLQSDNGREFVNSVISELSTLWPQLLLVTGRARHPQSQGAVERLNGVIQDKLKIWMQENNSKKWSIGLKIVQWQVNISMHETTKHTPFKVTFGEELSVGLSSTNLPESVLDGICYEDDLDKFFSEDGNYGEREDDESRKTEQQPEDEEVPEKPESEKG
ncbi:KRAB-A domain-containing protein 2-like [Palaemon carinicauda]|uniref:KRAB-A domain-containing protein 2-like n=1 Tax=Palaemon carinicauda TaxID=392227 RepID=UPI0035B65354